MPNNNSFPIIPLAIVALIGGITGELIRRNHPEQPTVSAGDVWVDTFPLTDDDFDPWGVRANLNPTYFKTNRVIAVSNDWVLYITDGYSTKSAQKIGLFTHKAFKLHPAP